MIHALALLILSQEPHLTNVAFNSKPVGATIVIDGKPIALKTPVPLGAPVRLTQGTHTVVFTFEGRSSEPREIYVGTRPLVIKGEVPAKVAPAP